VAEPSWLGFLDEHERAAVEAAQADVKEWRRLGLNELATQLKYLAEADPTGERRETLKRLRAAVGTETKLRATALERIKHAAQTRMPAPSPTEATQREDGAQASVPALSSEEAATGLQHEQPSMPAQRSAAEAEAGTAHAPESEPAAQHLHTKKRQTWLPFLSEHERAEYDAAKADVREWRQRGLDEPRVRQRYLAAPDPTGQRQATFQRLRAALNTTERLRQRARAREQRARAGSPAAEPPCDPQPWVAYLDEHERAQVYAAQDSIREWRRRGLHNARVEQAYLAAPDPTGERGATYRRLLAAVNTEKRLRAVANRRRARVRLGLPAQKPLGPTRAWLAYLDEHERAEADAVRDDAAEWRKRRLNNEQALREFLAEPGHVELYERLRVAVNAEARLRARAAQRKNSEERERQRQQRKSLRVESGGNGQGKVIHAPRGFIDFRLR
jgi:hypothetical protein